MDLSVSREPGNPWPSRLPFVADATSMSQNDWIDSLNQGRVNLAEYLQFVQDQGSAVDLGIIRECLNGPYGRENFVHIRGTEWETEVDESKGARLFQEQLPHENTFDGVWEGNIATGKWKFSDYLAWTAKYKKEINREVIFYALGAADGSKNYQLLKGSPLADDKDIITNAVIFKVPLEIICDTVSSEKLIDIIVHLINKNFIRSLDRLRNIKDSSGKFLIDNFDIVMAMVAKSGTELANASEGLKDNIYIVRAAIQAYEFAYLHASPRIQALLEEEEKKAGNAGDNGDELELPPPPKPPQRDPVVATPLVTPVVTPVVTPSVAPPEVELINVGILEIDPPEPEPTGLIESCVKYIGECCSGIWRLISSCFR